MEHPHPAGTTYSQAIELAHRRRMALTLRMWRSGEEALDRLANGATRAGYERAIAHALRTLPPDADMPSLVRHYCERGAGIDACVRAACVVGDGQGRIVPAIVRNASYWRRLQGLVGAACT